MYRSFAFTLFLALAAFTQPSMAQMFDDEFNGFVLDSRWRWVREERAYWSLDASALQITSQLGALNGTDFNDVKNILLQTAPATEDFRFMTKVDFRPDSSLHNAGLIYYLDDDNYVRVSRGMHEGINGVWMEIEQLGLPEISFVADVTVNPVYLRLSRMGGSVFRATYSPNDVDWFQIAERNTAFPSGGTPRIGLQAANGRGSVTTSRIPARFDFFRTVLGAVSGAPQAALPALLALYPAPARAGEPLVVSYEMPSGDGAIRLTDMLGREVWRGTAQRSTGTAQQTVPTAGLPAGTYTLRLENGARSVQRQVILQ